ncbi:MAG: hypothetical protein O2960_27365 [Verrucomicrobia bacterium]|nr:hypothetical protein [Verrucomicrobiota bacterium]
MNPNPVELRRIPDADHAKCGVQWNRAVGASSKGEVFLESLRIVFGAMCIVAIVAGISFLGVSIVMLLIEALKALIAFLATLVLIAVVVFFIIAAALGSDKK